MKRLNKNWFYLLIILGLWIVLVVANYTSNTFLTGWDTLHPEFDFPTNFQRLIQGVWRGEQGLGTVAAHSHMADLPRVIILWLFQFFVPLNILRYSYVFLCLLLGPVGVYFLLQYIFFQKKQIASLIGLLGALFYLMNFSTLQQFHVPFEMFPTQWASLPWLILFSLKFLKKPKRKWLVSLGLVVIFSTSQAYAAHLWYPLFGLYALFILLYSYLAKISAKIGLTLIGLVLLLNAFWLLPNLYFIKTNGFVTRENLNNQLYSQEFLAKNRATGTIQEFPLIKGFYFDWNAYDFEDKTHGNLMPQWNSHLENWDVLFIGYGLFFVALVGLIVSIIKKDKLFISLSPFFLIPFILLANKTVPFSYVFDLLLRLPFFEEILRFSFTKISILALFGQTLFIAYVLFWLGLLIKSRVIKIVLAIAFCLGLLVYFYPAFQGYLISPLVKQKIPQSYFNYWGFMRQQPKGKILTLPLYNNTGWVYYDWGYQGSGLIWFGSHQAVLDRDFDRWSSFNEQAYKEFYFALYNNNLDLFMNTIKKYRIRYILWDLAANPPVLKNRDQLTLKKETERFFQIMEVNNSVRKLAEFDNLLLYETNQVQPQAEILLINRKLSPSYKWGLADFQYLESDYYTDLSGSQDSGYLFRDVLISQNQINPDGLSLEMKENRIQVKWNQVEFSTKRALLFDYLDMTGLVENNSNLALNKENFSLVYSVNKDTHGIIVPLTNVSHSPAYLIGVLSKYKSGFPLRLCLRNLYVRNCSINDQLIKHTDFGWDYFLAGGTQEITNFELHINALSYGGVNSVSELRQVVIVPLPLEKLAEIKSITESETEIDNDKLVYWQAMNKEWQVYEVKPGLATVFPFIFGNKIGDKVLINNWANGWRLNSSNNQDPTSNIYIVFWPQYLQYIGFALIVFAIVWIYFYKKPKNTKIYGHTKIKRVVSKKKPKQKTNTELV